MNVIRRFAFFTAVLALLLAGCEEEQQPVASSPAPVNTGSADFARFVAVGNSITAGFQSNALSERDQVWSFSSIIARQVGTGFEQPLILNPGIGSRQRLVSLTGPVIEYEIGVAPVPASNLNAALSRPYNNLGIPGALVSDLLDSADFVQKSASRVNPFFALVLRDRLLGNSIVAQARALNPTFISLWIGTNDVMGYATSGGTSGSNVGGGNPPRTRPTEADLFDLLYRQGVDALRGTGAKIVVANLPDVTAIPYFFTVPSQGLALTRQGQVDSLNAAWAPFGIGGFRIGANGFVGFSSSGAPKKLGPGEYVLLTVPQDSLSRFGMGSQFPIPNKYVLDSAEVAIAQAAVGAYNASIDSIARNRGIPVVNINAIFNQIKASGLYVPGLGTFSPAFVTGGLFSYDGIHPSSRGHCIAANEFIKVINTAYGAQIPQIDPVRAPGMPLGKYDPGLTSYRAPLYLQTIMR